MVSNSPFSPRRARADLVAALPAVGMFAGALLGVILGLTRGVGGRLLSAASASRPGWSSGCCCAWHCAPTRDRP